MTAQEIFYYTISACSWIFIIMMVIIFYRINQCISQWKRLVNRLEATINSIPKTVRGVIAEIIIGLIKKIGPASARATSRQGGDNNER